MKQEKGEVVWTTSNWDYRLYYIYMQIIMTKDLISDTFFKSLLKPDLLSWPPSAEPQHECSLEGHCWAAPEDCPRKHCEWSVSLCPPDYIENDLILTKAKTNVQVWSHLTEETALRSTNITSSVVKTFLLTQTWAQMSAGFLVQPTQNTLTDQSTLWRLIAVD